MYQTKKERPFLAVIHTRTGNEREVRDKMKRLQEKGYIRSWKAGPTGYLKQTNGRLSDRVKLKHLHPSAIIAPWGFVDLSGRYHTPITNIRMNEYIQEIKDYGNPETYFHALACTN